MLDSGAAGPGFKSQPRRCRVIAKFHYTDMDTDTDTDPNGPARTQRSFTAKKSVSVSVQLNLAITVLGKLLTPVVPLFTKQRNW